MNPLKIEGLVLNLFGPFTVHSSMYLVSKTLRSIGIPLNRSLLQTLFFFPRDRSSKRFFIYPWKLPTYLIVLFILIFHPIKLTIPLKRINLSNKNFLPNTYFQPIILQDSSKTCTLQNCIIIEKEVTVSKRKGNQVSHQLPRLSRSPRTDTDLTHHHPFFAVPRHLALRDSPIVRAIIIVQVPR